MCYERSRCCRRSPARAPPAAAAYDSGGVISAVFVAARSPNDEVAGNYILATAERLLAGNGAIEFHNIYGDATRADSAAGDTRVRVVGRSRARVRRRVIQPRRLPSKNYAPQQKYETKPVFVLGGVPAALVPDVFLPSFSYVSTRFIRLRVYHVAGACASASGLVGQQIRASATNPQRGER
ncbi:hypothetical protein EVAR_62750_1 [Eumeta japonica]|uniref:Uncharacterized protein n=1 Tax=Eumeta variegata TaxID=151549 RepID=A0A4C1ZAS5_EUMVA|nr:hypothetical protein EVAR_62750_1 [Eumeta japonica]